MNSLSCKKVYPWGWSLVQSSSEKDVLSMFVKGSEQRNKLKDEVMGYIVCQSEGYISDEDQETAADAILEEFNALKANI
jgi:hypothetical protein